MYGKIFRSMYEGSLCGQWEALVTFQQMIVLCDCEGFVDMSIDAMHRTTTIPIKILEKGVSMLEKPDPSSRNPNEDGCRIIKIRESFGWKIVNYEYYSKMSKYCHRKEYLRNYMREYMRKKRKKGD